VVRATRVELAMGGGTVKTESIPVDVRAFGTVVGVALVGLTLAAVAAFTPWYPPGSGDAGVIELRGPAAPAAQR
jgi:hypothetical protein